MNTTPPALLLIDIQRAFDDIAYWGGQRNNPQAEAQAGRLLAFWRSRQWPIFHVRHCSTTPGSPLAKGLPGNEFHEAVTPIAGEPVIEKNVNSGFIGTDLKEQLDARGITQVVIAGLTTDHCVSTTTRMAGNFGYETIVVSDATASFRKQSPSGKEFSAEIIHETALASLHEEFATVLSVEAVIESLKEIT